MVEISINLKFWTKKTNIRKPVLPLDERVIMLWTIDTYQNEREAKKPYLNVLKEVKVGT